MAYRALNMEQAREIRKKWAAGIVLDALCDEYNVGAISILSVIGEITYKEKPHRLLENPEPSYKKCFRCGWYNTIETYCPGCQAEMRGKGIKE